MTTPKKKVLVLCTGNSARSQMAEGLLRHEGGDRFEVYSAGTKPGRVRPEAIAVMDEIGIDISGHRSKSVDEFVGVDLDFVITVCNNAYESCPIFPGQTRRLHWPFEDPQRSKVPRLIEGLHSGGSAIRSTAGSWSFWMETKARKLGSVAASSALRYSAHVTGILPPVSLRPNRLLGAPA